MYGAKAHRARRKAAEDLTKQLQGTFSKYPSSAHFVIGHSHGENVAPLCNPNLTGVLHGIVCLATPFLDCAARSEDFLLWFSVAGFVSISLAVVFAEADYAIPEFMVIASSMAAGAGFLMLVFKYLYPKLKEIRELAIELTTGCWRKQTPILSVRLSRDEAATWRCSVSWLSRVPEVMRHIFQFVIEGELFGRHWAAYWNRNDGGNNCHFIHRWPPA